MPSRIPLRTASFVIAVAILAVALHLTMSAAPPAAVATTTRPTRVVQQRRNVPERSLAAGKLLVADRSLVDRNFFETVVLLIAYSRDGAAGLILNRQTKVALERILPGLHVPKPVAGLVFLGGPVEFSEARALVRSSTERRDAYRVLNGVYLLDSLDTINSALAGGAGPDRVRVYVGYTGWGTGQLEREVLSGAWHVFDDDIDVVFDPTPDTLWRRQIRRTEALMASGSRNIRHRDVGISGCRRRALMPDDSMSRCSNIPPSGPCNTSTS